LPEEVKRQGVITQKQSTSMSQAIALVSPNGTYDDVYLSNYINIRLKDSLSRVEGVGSIMVFGAKDFGMRIWLNPDKLKARNLTTQEVLQTIREQNVQVAAGKIGASPSPADQQFQYTVRTMGRLKESGQFEDIVVKIGPKGQIVRLKDIAKIELDSQSYNSYCNFNGSPSVAMGIYQRPGANSLEVANGLMKTIERLSEDFPDDLEYRVAYDPTLFITESLREVIRTLGIAVLLVILMVYLFLQDLRTTLIPALTIPVSLIGTLAAMKVMGMSVNTMSLFGLVLAIGIVVDDAIVVVENTKRLIDEEKLSARQAAIKAMEQITGPVIATTLVLLSVFVPTALIGGVSGKLYSQFAMTISTATVFSTINALTLSPALCALLLRPTPQKRGLLFRLFNRLMDAGTQSYMSVVKRLTRVSVVGMVIFGLICGLGYLGLKFTPGGFIPNEDEGYFLIGLRLPDGASLHRTREVTDQVAAILESTPGVKNNFAIGGLSVLDGFIPVPNGATFFVMLDPWSKRRDPSLHVEGILESVNMSLFGVSEAMGFAFAMPPIQGMGNAAGFEMQVQDRGGAGLETLERVGNELTFKGNSDPGLTGVRSTFRASVPQLYLAIDRTKAKMLNVSLSEIFNTLQTNLGSTYVNDFNLFTKTFKVLAQADKNFRNNVEDIKRLEVRNGDGNMVPLGTLLDVQDAVGPQTVTHYNMYPSTTINGAPNMGQSTGQAMAAIEKICDETLPSTMGFEWSGMSYQQIQAGNKAPLIFGLAALFAFLFLAAQYESWAIPVAIVFSVPLALFGAIAFTFFRSLDNNIYTQIGFVLLIGLATKTAILLVEFAKKLHEEDGYTITEAALEASRLRFRPILMTALSFVLGVVPLLIAQGAGASARIALGTAVFGGMLIATILGVFLIPTFYVFVQKAAEFVRPRKTTTPQ
ncbi:MAG: efflux RND transporter permease subunit, partial [Phycisphaeraceae bacterium]|nr:efflux RND transporter permease subunit [Phycisphaeraceae bacterium]